MKRLLILLVFAASACYAGRPEYTARRAVRKERVRLIRMAKAGYNHPDLRYLRQACRPRRSYQFDEKHEQQIYDQALAKAQAQELPKL